MGDGLTGTRRLTHWPRTVAALAFGLAGLVLPAAWFLPATLHAKSPVYHTLLFVGVPGAAAAIAGAALGGAILRPAPRAGPGRAALRGALVATVALALYCLLFSVALALTEPGPGRWNVLGLTALMLEGSALAAWLPAAALGAGVGWTLFLLGRRETT